MNWDFIYRGENKDLDEETRAATGGSFVRLADGWTHYQIGGPESSSPVVLVHGFTIPYFIWDPTFQELTSAGYRVLRYDLFGRGYSDRPRIQYNLQLFVRQLANLLDALEVSQIDLIGLSMGGGIAAAYAVESSDRVRKLILIDPIGTQPMPLGPLYRAAFLPGLGELFLGLIGNERLVKGTASSLFDPKYVAAFEDQVRIQMSFRGFKRAVLSTLRSGIVEGFPRIYESLGKLTTPVLLLWGRNDLTLPVSQSEMILKQVPRAEFHIFEDCGHIPHYERPELVNPILLQFLS